MQFNNDEVPGPDMQRNPIPREDHRSSCETELENKVFALQMACVILSALLVAASISHVAAFFKTFCS